MNLQLPPKNAKQKEINDWLYQRAVDQHTTLYEIQEQWEKEHKSIAWYKSFGVWFAIILTILTIFIVVNFYLIDVEHMKITILGYTFTR